MERSGTPKSPVRRPQSGRRMRPKNKTTLCVYPGFPAAFLKTALKKAIFLFGKTEPAKPEES
jgi:hypothetical protein